jgi:hypothetical protein
MEDSMTKISIRVKSMDSSGRKLVTKEQQMLALHVPIEDYLRIKN